MGFRRFGGRVFDSRDQEKSPAVIVINQKMAEMFWPAQNPVGQTIQAGDPPSSVTVIGVVADSKYDGLDDAAKPFFYFTLPQRYQQSLNVIVRTRGDPALLQVPLAQAMQRIGFSAPIQPATYDAWMNVTLLGERVAAIVVEVLSGLGLALAIVGLAAAISYSVSEHRKELGIRVALGAQGWQLMRMILRQTGVVAGIGIAIGILLGVGGTVLLKSQLFGIGSVELPVLLPVAIGVLAVSLAVAYLSALPVE